MRAAGTIAKSDVPVAVRARTAVLDPNVSGETSLGETESDPTLLSSSTISLGAELLDPTPAPTSARAPLPSPPSPVSLATPAPASRTSVPGARGPFPLDTTPAILRRRTRRGTWIAATAIVLGASIVAGVVLFGRQPGPPDAPDMPPRTVSLGTEPAATARLHVTTSPAGAEVEIDGRSIGTGPSVQTLAAGTRHVVRAIDAHGAELSRDEVTLGEGEIRELTLSARPVSASLRVATTPPGASVRVDGELLGETPLSVDVAPSPHHVEVWLTGYDPVADDVSFAGPGEQAMLSFALRRQATRPAPDRHPPPSTAARGTGTLRIATDPYSEVYEGSRHLGTTPLQTTLPVGHHRLSLRSPGHAPRVAEVDITADEVTRLRLSL